MTDQGGNADQGGDEVLRMPASTLDELLSRMREPMKLDDIRTRQGKEYVSGGDVVYNMFTDFGPFGWESRVRRLEWTPAREAWVDVLDDKGKPKIDRVTGEVEQRCGYSSCAIAIVRVTMHLPDGRCVKRDGVGAASALMQLTPEEAVEGAVKAAETDAIKRALYANGPRYGLALRFKDRDERIALGLTERNAAVEKARRARAQNTKGANPPGAQAAASAPAASNEADELRRKIGGALKHMTSEPVKARVMAALEAAKEDVARLKAILGGVKEQLVREADQAAALSPPASQGQATSGATSPAGTSAAPNDQGAAASSQGTKSSAARADMESNPTAVTPTLDPPRREQPTVEGHGTVYGEKADEANGEKSPATPDSLAWKLVVCDPDPFVASQLASGMTPSTAPPFGVVLPMDPSQGQLEAVGWQAPGASALALASLPDSQAVLPALATAAAVHAMALLGRREAVAWLWQQLGMPRKDEGRQPNGYQLRLFAWAAASQARRAEARKSEQLIRE